MAFPTSPMKSLRNNKSAGSSAAFIFLVFLFVLSFSNQLGMDSRNIAMDARNVGRYIPSRLEKRMMDVSRSELQYDKPMADECDLFLNESKKEFYSEYQRYLATLDTFAHETRIFTMEVEDLRLLPTEKRKEMCQKIDKVLHGSFRAKEDCSSTNAGFVEPLLPPLRHPRSCQKGKEEPFKLNIEYLVHDFGEMCRQLDPGSRTVFFDLGASLEFDAVENPTLALVKLYNRFGIKFDHYYAFNKTRTSPKKVYEKLPEQILDAYHWYNVPIESSSVSKNNPWKAILSTLTPNDLVVIKLDVEDESIEIPLARELLQEKYAPLVDHVYFENPKPGTLQDSLDLFTSLREAGIAAHPWV